MIPLHILEKLLRDQAQLRRRIEHLEGLELPSTVTIEGEFRLKDPDVNHGMTDEVPTTVYGQLGIYDGLAGGLRIRGFTDSDANFPLNLVGVHGAADPTDTRPAVMITAFKKSGTTVVAIGAAETALGIDSDADGTAEIEVLGDGKLGVGKTPGTPLDVSGKIRTDDQVESTVATGTAPLVVASTTVVTNLNVDSLDGRDEGAFVLLAGRSGGQTLYGGIGSGDDLVLESTSHATKGVTQVNGILTIED